MPAIDNFWAVVPAGGAGTRLWPLSRAASPKFLHDLTGTGRSLLQATVDRLAPLAGDRVLVVTGRGAPRGRARASCPGCDAAVLAEPSPRDSMAAIGLAAAVLERRDPDAVMGSFAADHVIADEAPSREAVRRAASRSPATAGWSRSASRPTHPSTAFGYVQLGERASPGTRRRRTPCVEFVEKPDADIAPRVPRHRRVPLERRHVRGPADACCSTCWRSGTPGFAAALRAIAAEPGAARRAVAGAAAKIAIDHAVAEPAAAAGRVAVVPADARLGRHRRLRLARRPARADGRLGDRARRRRTACAAVDAAVWWCPAPAAVSPSSASTTSWSSTPRTPCWSPPGRTRRGQGRGRTGLRGGRPGRPDLRAAGRRPQIASGSGESV